MSLLPINSKNFIVVDIDDLRDVCGYNDEETQTYGCSHPENDDQYCLASGCPLGFLKETRDGDMVKIYKNSESYEKIKQFFSFA